MKFSFLCGGYGQKKVFNHDARHIYSNTPPVQESLKRYIQCFIHF